MFPSTEDSFQQNISNIALRNFCLYLVSFDLDSIFTIFNVDPPE